MDEHLKGGAAALAIDGRGQLRVSVDAALGGEPRELATRRKPEHSGGTGPCAKRCFTPPVGAISRERVSKKMVGGSGVPDPVEIERGERLLKSAAAVLDAHLAGKRWITREQLTLADLAIAAPLMHTAAAQLPVTEYDHVQSWFARVRALDAWINTEAVAPFSK